MRDVDREHVCSRNQAKVMCSACLAEVIPGELVVVSLNTLLWFSNNKVRQTDHAQAHSDERLICPGVSRMGLETRSSMVAQRRPNQERLTQGANSCGG